MSEKVKVADLKRHPRNYRVHPKDQLAHIVASIKEHGFYRNVVIAKDGTILAGHGVVEAAKEMGLEEIPAIRLDIGPNDPRALKVLTGDNEIGRLAEVDDRSLTETLKLIMVESEGGLTGTGFDEPMLSALVMVTRPESEIRTAKDAAEWVGMPEFKAAKEIPRLVIRFDSEAERDSFMKKINATVINSRSGLTLGIWYPERKREDLQSVRFDKKQPEPAASK